MYFPQAKNWKGISGPQLRAILEAHGMTQKECAALIGADSRSVTRWIMGQAKMSYSFWYTLMCKLPKSVPATTEVSEDS